MEESYLQNYKKNAAEGAIWLIIKRVLIQVIFTISNIALARLLFPDDFGTFAIIGFATNFFLVFCDLGFAPSLVQKKGKVTTADLRTAFTFQLLLVLLTIIVIFNLAQYVSEYFNLGEKGTALFRFYSLHLLFLPFKTTSGALLERNLEYRKLVSIETIDLLMSSLVTVLGAFAGFGVFSFVIGNLSGHFVAVFLYLWFSPWRLGLSISKPRLISLARFGLPIQTNLFFGLFYGPLVLLYLGKAVGSENLGYFHFAASLAVLPLAVSEIINRIIFPLGSRLQTDEKVFRKIIERSIMIVSMTSFPILALGLVSAREIIHFIYTDKWLPSLPALYLGLAQSAVVAFTGVFSQMLLAFGRVNYQRNMSFTWAVLTWILAPFLIGKYNFVGMSLTGFLVSCTGFWLLIKLRREVEFSILSNTLSYFVSAIFAGFSVFAMLSFFANSGYFFIFSVITGAFIYILGVMLLAKKQFIQNLVLVKNLIFRR